MSLEERLINEARNLRRHSKHLPSRHTLSRKARQEAELVCSTGKITAKIGDRFTDHSGEWEIVRFRTDRIYSPPDVGGIPIVVVKPFGKELPSWFERHANEDGTIDWCGDSVASALLSKQEGKS